MADIFDVLLEPEIGWKRYDNEDTMFVYTGTVRESNVAAYKGSYNYIANSSHKISFVFKGSKLRIIGNRRNAYRSNNVTIKIDGVPYVFSAC